MEVFDHFDIGTNDLTQTAISWQHLTWNPSKLWYIKGKSGYSFIDNRVA